MLELLFLVAAIPNPPLTQLVMAERPSLQSIALYYSPHCPHSKKVLSSIKKMNLSIPLKDVTQDQEAKKDLKSIGGHSIVPCLIVNGAPIYNDGDIINWLFYHQDQLPRKA